MTTIDTIADALIARIHTLGTDDYAVRAVTEWSGPIQASGNAAAAVVEYDGNNEVTMGDASDIRFKVTMLVPKVSDRTGRSRLYTFAGTADTSGSVRSAVNGTLGGTVAFSTVTGDGGLREYAIGGGDEAAANYIGIEFAVLVGT